ncbi:nitroreductase family protein [Pedococcus sp. 2YAF34]|uniref:nitroreductase family protein n=1 Tax=Pedococcus sp. 2YAF34 TaxID=3233032 RepID=UPI003F9D34DA
METWDALRARRNVRQLTEQPVPDEALGRILEAGRRAASAGNWQPWDFVVVTDRAQLVELAKVWQGAKHVAGATAAIAIVAPDPQDDRQSALLQYDLGQATYAMTIAAADLGSARATRRPPTRIKPGPFSAFPKDGSLPTCSPSVIRRTSRWTSSSG